MRSLQDFSLIQQHIMRYQKDLDKEPQDAFYFFLLSLVLSLQDDEIEDSITDNSYLAKIGDGAGHDRGIDAVYIDETGSTPTIHFFNCKYTAKFEKTENHFPSNEIDKISTFLHQLMYKDESLEAQINPILYGKVKEIWNIFRTANPNFVFHICGNLYNGFIEDEKDRFEREIHRHSNFAIEYHLINDLVRRVTGRGKQIVNARLRAISRNYFEKSNGDIRALIVNIEAIELIRVVLDNEQLRNEVDLEDYAVLHEFPILEDAFEDNVRVYLRQRSKINRNITKTALSDDNVRFFYFNNGITITCSKYSYRKGQSPIIELKNLQVVNGSQTIHALYEAYRDNPSCLEEIDLLCRIYETSNSDLTTNIAEYTNSQNPVKSRDIRSIDYIQQKLESEFEALGLYYERKKNQHSDHPKNLRIDAEKTGQVLFAFYNKRPSDAKNKKSLIFAEWYENVFNDDITADKVLLAYRLFERIEKEKSFVKSESLSLDSKERFEEEFFLLYASYHILYIMGELAWRYDIQLVFDNLEEIWSLYIESVDVVKHLIDLERHLESEHSESYTHASFFKSGKPQRLFEEHYSQ